MDHRAGPASADRPQPPGCYHPGDLRPVHSEESNEAWLLSPPESAEIPPVGLGAFFFIFDRPHTITRR